MASFGGFGAGQKSEEKSDKPKPIDKSTPWMAASEGHLERLRESLSALNLTPTAADENGYTLAHAAAAYNQAQVLSWLVSQDGVNINAPDHDGDTPLHHVEHLEMAENLVQVLHADHTVRNNDGMTALQVKKQDLEDLMDSDEEDPELRALVSFLESIA